MDLDHARRRVQESPDVPPLSDVLLELLELAGKLDVSLAAAHQRVQDLEREMAEMTRNLRAGLRP